MSYEMENAHHVAGSANKCLMMREPTKFLDGLCNQKVAIWVLVSSVCKASTRMRSNSKDCERITRYRRKSAENCRNTAEIVERGGKIALA